VKKFPALDRAIRHEIATARAACGMTQRELCAKLKRRNNYIQNIESGTQSVGAAELHIIARACGSTGNELLGRAIQAADK
jgi:transcriptional regulator with XRE-family HTH domain